MAHAYLSARIFSKSFGGKIKHIWTDVAMLKIYHKRKNFLF